MNQDLLDAVVVGGGPAGLAAATWLARYRCSVLLYDSEEHRNRWTELSHGYLGSDPISPGELLVRSRADLAKYPGGRVTGGRVDSIRRAGDAFVVVADDGEVRCRRVILATGVVDAFPEVEGFFEHYGASVFHCPTCDGYEAKGRKVVVFGWSAEVAGFARGLLNWASEVTVVTDGRGFEGDAQEREVLAGRGIPLFESEAKRLIGGRGSLEGVELRGGQAIDCDIAFFSIDHSPRTELAEQLGCALDDEGYLKVGENGQTSSEGVYAAGDVTPGTQLVQIAAAQGATAGVCCALTL